MAVITISRQNGSLGDELATYLAGKLHCQIISRAYAMENFFAESEEDDISEKLSDSAKFFLAEVPGENGATYKDLLTRRITAIADEAENLIVLGLGGCAMLESRQDTVNIRVLAGLETRKDRIARRYNVSPEEAESTISIGDRKHKRFVSIVFGEDLAENTLYDLTFNTDQLSVEECAAAVLALIEKKEARLRISEETTGDDSIDHQTSTPVFKNETEAEFAKILDMYGIEWMYEPKTFPIEWDEEGNIKMAFSPDFYLPRFNLYLELTTMDQKYVTKKNRKARMVMELYPGTNVRIVYKKDFQELIERLRSFGG
ncbi:MAG: cytidylate kinase family protein [Clostridiales bacterium]|nr:cytidylate kinase family protein [Clostridiales bacterium]